MLLEMIPNRAGCFLHEEGRSTLSGVFIMQEISFYSIPEEQSSAETYRLK